MAQTCSMADNVAHEPAIATEAVPRAFTDQMEPIHEQHLSDHDRGHAAWRLLIAAFIFEALLWGFPLSYGVFQSYYSQQPQFIGNPYLSVVGSIASGISYLAAPIMVPLTKRYAKYRRHAILVGWPLCLLGLVAGSFAQALGALVLTQGVMYGVGFVIFYYPILSMVNELWIARRGMAYGLLCSASGLSGAVFPFIVQKLLASYGYPTTLRAIAIGLAILTGPLLPIFRGRLPESESSASATAPIHWKAFKAPLFWLYSLSNFAMGLGYFFPSLYLPSYAGSQGLTSTQGALLLSLMSCAQVLGQLSFGYFSDCKQLVDPLATISTVVAAISAYACWGLASSFRVLVAFALLYGFFAAGYTALWGRMGSKVSSEPSGAFMAFAMLNAGKGVGNVLAGPISGALLSGSAATGGFGAGRYERLILFTGSSMALSGAIIVGWHWRLWSGIWR